MEMICNQLLWLIQVNQLMSECESENHNVGSQ